MHFYFAHLKAIEVLILHGHFEDLGIVLRGHLEGLEGGAALLVQVGDLVHVGQAQHLQQQAELIQATDISGYFEKGKYIMGPVTKRSYDKTVQ